ncbi:MAG: RnfABCDGE type electron transport complex subunit D [Spirochaetia bacterium]|jgi:Na+-transporting NADH:ubiquinone oxidoreductase subunit B|nr:RnfABCDGE type electron transport complex subunit D [Spirochaetia bacterium]
MRKVLYSLSPVFIFAVFIYGIRFLAVSVLVFAAGILTEYLFMKKSGKKTSEAVLVTCMIYTLSLPPAVPFWIAAVGIVFGVLFGKCVYGGFGRNIFNPAITGRLFIYIAFPGKMTALWLAPSIFGIKAIDGMTSATPLEMMREGVLPDLWHLLTGLRAGSAGEGAAVLIILAAFYLIYTKTANWRTMASTLISFSLLTGVLFAAGVLKAFPLIEGLLSGSILFVAVFMTTDPVSAPKKPLSLWIYGAIIGFTAAIVRTFSLFPEGTSFALLFGNTFAALLDELVAKKKAKPSAATAAPDAVKG